MRKKIFLIHGKGEKNGLGSESGGDLDTVSSNAFYAAWINEASNNPAQYGIDYEYDFVNYQEGLRHLDVHSGSDLYLPDFPIDALAPSLQMHRLRRKESLHARSGLFNHVDSIRRLFYKSSETFPDRWKSAFNDLRKQSGKILSDRKFYEINNARYYAGLFHSLAFQIYDNQTVSDVVRKIEHYLFGNQFQKLKNQLADSLDSFLKNDLIDKIPQSQVEDRLLLFDSSRSDYGHRARIERSNQLLSLIVESISVMTKTYFLIANLRGSLPENGKTDLLSWTEEIRDNLMNTIGDLHGLLTKISDANPDNEQANTMVGYSGKLHSLLTDFLYDNVMEDFSSKEEIFRTHLTEESTGAPVSDVEIVFNVKKGNIEISPLGFPEQRSKSLSIPTDEKGHAGIKIHGNIQTDYGITATYDELNFLTYPEELQLGDSYFDEHPKPGDLEFKMAEFLENGRDKTSDSSLNIDSIEQGGEETPERSISVKKQMIERHVQYLRDKDVRLIRLDDHHPYSPEILKKLKSLQENSLIEAIMLSSLPSGEHQPKEDQLCGADLIYKQFVEDTETDNSGMEKLREVTHHQDLHIQPRDIGIELSKLIGSSFSKVKMAEGLRRIDGKQDFQNILSNRGWKSVIEDYEKRLGKVLPRLGKCLYQIELAIPPENGSYKEHAGWKKYTNPIPYFFGDKGERQQLYKSLYARQPGNRVRILCALSPFCDSDKGEPNINVASALNYLTNQFQFDYFFYAYGSFLLSTRRVNENGFDIDLSKLVSKIGSPSDGGHPGAATGSPESNPSFPKRRFDSVNDENFAEYLFYILNTVESHTGLDLVRIKEIYPQEFESGIKPYLQQLEEKSYLMTAVSSYSSARICIAPSVYTDEEEPEMSMPLALTHLNNRFSMDYFFYLKSSTQLAMRNINDSRMTLNLSELAQLIGTERNGGHRKAASCEPRFNPAFPEEKLKYIDNENFESFLQYIGELFSTHLGFDRVRTKSLR